MVVVLIACPARATVLDLTTEGSYGEINGAGFLQFDSIPTGSGLIDAFLRIQGFGVQQGYNSDYRPVEFDEDTSPQNNQSVQLSSIPVCTLDGTEYREFLLDINQNGNPILSLDDLKIALHTAPDLTGFASIFASPIYDLDAGGDNWIMLDYRLNGGSGHGDMAALIPNSLFTGPDTQYVYLYSKAGENSIADDGFEEWAYGCEGPLVPEPATVALLGLGGLLMLRRRRK
jgi:hypothetical protein